jgi:hypothetical protein
MKDMKKEHIEKTREMIKYIIFQKEENYKTFLTKIILKIPMV